MIAKVIAWDQDRTAALRRLARALEATEVAGSVTNVDFLARLAGHPDFVAGAVDTGFIARHRQELLPPAGPASDRALALAALAVMLERAEHAAELAAVSGDPWSPWHRTDGWRQNLGTRVPLVFLEGEQRYEIAVAHGRRDSPPSPPGGAMEAAVARLPDRRLEATLGGPRLRASVVRDGRLLWVLAPGETRRLELEDPHDAEALDAGGGGSLTAPMPGKVIQVAVEEGQAVTRGQLLLILEAMKMEHSIVAPGDGRVAAVRFGAGELVGEGEELIAFEAAEE
mgnify:CR=1 FL=1